MEPGSKCHLGLVYNKHVCPQEPPLLRFCKNISAGHWPRIFIGTIHVPYVRVWDAIPDNVKQAFASSKRVFFELDLTKGASFCFMSKVIIMFFTEKTLKLQKYPILFVIFCKI